MKIAFRQLCSRAAGEAKAAKNLRGAERHKQWQGAARRFRGLSERLRLRLECRNIYLAPHGYSVSFTRAGDHFTRFFAGVSEESLSSAIRFRDEALKFFGDTQNSVPAHVLKALGLPTHVPGITRDCGNRSYKVRNAAALKSGRQIEFSFKYLSEEDAYAAAIECLEASIRAK